MPTEKRLLLAAASHFGRHGFDGARLEDIAGDAGISRPSLLYYFQTKEALYAAVIENAFSDLGLALMSAMADDQPFEKRFDHVVSTYPSFLEKNPPMSALLLREILDDHGPGHELLMQTALPVLEQVESFMRSEGKDRLRPNLPLREALLHIICTTLVKNAAGDLTDMFFGKVDRTRKLAHLLFFKD